MTRLAKAMSKAMRLVLDEMAQIWQQQFLLHTGRTPPRSSMLATTQEFPLHLRAIQSQLQQPNSPLQDLIGFESQDFESLYVEIPTTAAHERLP